MSIVLLELDESQLALLNAKLSLLEQDNLPSDLLDEAQALFLNRIRTRFLNTEAPDGSQWAVSLASLYRQKIGRDGKTGFDTGKLFHSLQASVSTDETRSIGTDVPYAGYFRNGTKYSPAREFLGFNDADLDLYVGFVQRRLTEAFAA